MWSATIMEHLKQDILCTVDGEAIEAKVDVTNLQGLSRLQARRLQALIASPQQAIAADSTSSRKKIYGRGQCLTRPRKRKRRNRHKKQLSQHAAFNCQTLEQETPVLYELITTEHCPILLEQKEQGVEVCNSSVETETNIKQVKNEIVALNLEQSVPRPLASGFPEIWADSRQELCEALPYFRSYHAGIYHHNNV